jgi:hypothetical protein
MNPTSTFNKVYEENDTLEFTGRGDSDFWFACVDLKVIKDRSLSPCDKTVFAVICAHVNTQTRSCPLRIKTIAEEAVCCVRSVQESLKALIERGVIEREQRFENGKQQASVYKIIGHHAPCYRGANSAPPAESASGRGADFAPTPESCAPRGAKKDTPSLPEPNIYETKDTSPPERETSFPTADAGIAPTTDRRSPDDACIRSGKALGVMKETLDYFLLKTGRAGIIAEELTALCNLEKIHTPQRVNKEIAEAAERFRKYDKPLCELTLTYIYKSLQHQNSLKSTKSKAPPKQEIYKAKSPDPYEGAYL